MTPVQKFHKHLIYRMCFEHGADPAVVKDFISEDQYLNVDLARSKPERAYDYLVSSLLSPNVTRASP